MTIDTDFHSHIAPSSAEQMIEAAKKKGMRARGVQAAEAAAHDHNMGSILPMTHR